MMAGIDMHNIKRVWVWMAPTTFASLVQKFGRCGQDVDKTGECVLYITPRFYQKHAMLALEQVSHVIEEEVKEEVRAELAEHEVDRAGGEEEEPAAAVVAQIRLAKQFVKLKSLVASRDAQHLVEYIITKACRCIVWDRFFDNANKCEFRQTPFAPNTS